MKYDCWLSIAAQKICQRNTQIAQQTRLGQVYVLLKLTAYRPSFQITDRSCKMENVHNIIIYNPQEEDEMVLKSWQKTRDKTKSITLTRDLVRHSRKDTKTDIQFRKAVRKPHKIQMIFPCPLCLFL